MRVVTIVNGYTGALCLQELVDQGDQVVGVVTSPGDPSPGATPETSVKLTADRNYLPVYQPPMKEVNSPTFIEVLRQLAPDLIVSMHFPVIFKKELLAIPRLGVVNEHPSRLPAGRGMTPSFWHMLVGDERNWISLHFLDPGIDTGDVISQGSIEITDDDTGATTSKKLSEEGHRLFAEALPLIRQGKAPRVPQKQIRGVESSYYSWKPHYARIDWERSAQEIALHVRTLTRPIGSQAWTRAAYAYLAGEEVNIRGAKVAQSIDVQEALPGEVVAVTGEGLLVQTGSGSLLITEADAPRYPEEGLRGLLPLISTGLSSFFG